MSYDWFNRQELLQKAKDKYHNCGGKEKAIEYYLGNRSVLKEKAKNKYKNLRLIRRNFMVLSNQLL